MQLVPVLEIRHGKGVHTEPKNSFVDQVVKEDAFSIVENWVDKGINRLHIVDVDAIESGEPENVDLVAKIKKQFPHIQLQILGGIKCIESAYIWADAGVDFLVLNGKAMRQKNLLDDICVEFPNRVLVEIDSRHGNVAMGAGEPTFKLTHLARQLEEDGVVGLVVTEVPENGHVNQKNLIEIIELSQSVDIPVYANGGIQQIGDLKSVLEIQKRKLSGVLIGKALYNGFCLNEANNLIQEYQAN